MLFIKHSHVVHQTLIHILFIKHWYVVYQTLTYCSSNIHMLFIKHSHIVHQTFTYCSSNIHMLFIRNSYVVHQIFSYSSSNIIKHWHIVHQILTCCSWKMLPVQCLRLTALTFTISDWSYLDKISWFWCFQWCEYTTNMCLCRRVQINDIQDYTEDLGEYQHYCNGKCSFF
jgi:hypothetical protein